MHLKVTCLIGQLQSSAKQKPQKKPLLLLRVNAFNDRSFGFSRIIGLHPLLRAKTEELIYKPIPFIPNKKPLLQKGFNSKVKE